MTVPSWFLGGGGSQVSAVHMDGFVPPIAHSNLTDIARAQYHPKADLMRGSFPSAHELVCKEGKGQRTVWVNEIASC